MKTPDYYFEEVVREVRSRPHIREIICDILAIVDRNRNELRKNLSQAVSRLSDPIEYSTVVELFFLDLIEVISEDDPKLDVVIDLREELRIQKYTAIPIIMQRAKQLWQAQVN